MLPCPECGVRLRKNNTKQGPVYMCSSCTGFMVPLQVLRKSDVSRSLVGQAWGQASHGRGEPGRPCPYCLHPMRMVSVIAEGHDIMIDVCPECFIMWFDPGELEDISAAAPTAQRIVTVHRIRKPDSRLPADRPDAAWKYVPALLGMPVEMDADTPAPLPAVTILSFLACVLVFYMTAGDLNAAVWDAGFFPEDILRNSGINLLAAFFLHGSLMHLISNMYFLLVFGNNVENDLGRFRFILLLLASHIGGFLLHASFLCNSPEQAATPLIGASAGISGIIAYYAITFPRHRIGFLFLFFWWIRLSAVAAIILYIIVQLVGAYYQVTEFTQVSYLAHVGGLTVGIAAGFAARYRRTQGGHEV